jgi:hypothetical protein
MGIFLKVLLPCEPSIMTPHFEQPASINILWGLFPFEHQYHPISLQLTYITFHIFFLSSTEPVI